MDINPLDIAIHIVNILVLFLILRTLLYKPVVKFMAARTERVRSELVSSAKERASASEMKAQYEQKLASADDRAHEQAIEIVQKANAEAAVIIDNANARAQEIICEAQDEARAQKEEAIKELQQEISGISIDIAEKILAREISEEDNRAIAESFFKKRVKHL